jgi:hypothetical protein
MKKLMILSIIMLLTLSTYGQGLFGGDYDPLHKVSLCERSQDNGFRIFTNFNPFISTYRFYDNNKYYMLSYEPYQVNELCANKWEYMRDTTSKYYYPYNNMYSGDIIKRNLRLYRLDDTINMVWNLASDDIIDVDFYSYFAEDWRMPNAKAYYYFDIYFSATDKNWGSYVKPLSEGRFEMGILKHSYTDSKQDKNKSYFHIIIFEPIGNEMYKIKENFKINL